MYTLGYKNNKQNYSIIHAEIIILPILSLCLYFTGVLSLYFPLSGDALRE